MLCNSSLTVCKELFWVRCHVLCAWNKSRVKSNRLVTVEVPKVQIKNLRRAGLTTLDRADPSSCIPQVVSGCGLQVHALWSVCDFLFTYLSEHESMTAQSVLVSGCNHGELLISTCVSFVTPGVHWELFFQRHLPPASSSLWHRPRLCLLHQKVVRPFTTPYQLYSLLIAMVRYVHVLIHFMGTRVFIKRWLEILTTLF